MDQFEWLIEKKCRSAVSLLNVHKFWFCPLGQKTEDL